MGPELMIPAIVIFFFSICGLGFRMLVKCSTPMEQLAGKTDPTFELEAAEKDVQRVWRSESTPVAPLYSFPNLDQFEERFAEAEAYEEKSKIIIFQFAQEVHEKYNISFDDIEVCEHMPVLLINGLEITVFSSSGRIKIGGEVIYDKKLHIDNFEKFCLKEVA